MRILFAAEDRDLARCCRELLADADTAVDTAFDGAQVLTAAAAAPYDLLVLTQSLPRVPWETVTARIRAAGTPVVLLLQGPLTVRALTSEPPVNACLAFPFTPAELRDAVRSVIEKKNSAETLSLGCVTVAVSSFRLGDAPVTAGELDILTALAAGRSVTSADARTYVQALNGKLEAQRLPVRIHYIKNEGFRTVNEYE